MKGVRSHTLNCVAFLLTHAGVLQSYLFLAILALAASAPPPPTYDSRNHVRPANSTSESKDQLYDKEKEVAHLIIELEKEIASDARKMYRESVREAEEELKKYNEMFAQIFPESPQKTYLDDQGKKYKKRLI